MKSSSFGCFEFSIVCSDQTMEAGKAISASVLIFESDTGRILLLWPDLLV